MASFTTVSLRIDFNQELEVVPARCLSENGSIFELLACPGLAEGAAAGDVVMVAHDGSFSVVRRAGNVAIHAIASPEVDADVMEVAFKRELTRVGGRLDGGIGGIRVYCVSATVGFPAIEAACSAALASCPGAQWMYANVYELGTQTPLPWVLAYS